VDGFGEDEALVHLGSVWVFGIRMRCRGEVMVSLSVYLVFCTYYEACFIPRRFMHVATSPVHITFSCSV